MCELTTLLATLGMGGSTAAGATAGAATAATAGATLSQIGTLVSIGGALAQGVGSYRASKANAAFIEQQKLQEQKINAVKDHRERAKFASSISQQAAELAGRGVNLDSATSIYLGQTAAKEMSFNSQSIRSTGQATQTELTGQQQAFNARGKMSLLRGGLSAAGSWLNREPDAWPGLTA